MRQSVQGSAILTEAGQNLSDEGRIAPFIEQEYGVGNNVRELK